VEPDGEGDGRTGLAQPRTAILQAWASGCLIQQGHVRICLFAALGPVPRLAGSMGQPRFHAPLSSLLAALGLAVLSLVLLRLLAQLALAAVSRCADPLIERVRSAHDQERVQRILEASLEARRRDPILDRSAARARSRRLLLTDLTGRPLSLLPEEIPAFQRSCCEELGLPAGSGWPQVRQQWRRQSLRWHPDHGGDTANWLRKLRAYEALRLLRGETRRWLPRPLPPLLAAPPPGRQQWWARWRPPARSQPR
jgi:hypothetical protein